MKKTITLLLALVLVFSGMSMLVSADSSDLSDYHAVSPRYKKLTNCWAGLTSTGGGWSDVSGGAGSAVGSVSISVTVILQRSNPHATTGWDDIVTLTDSAPYSASCGTSHYIATPGVYRTHTIAKVYDEDGGYIEQALANSDHITIK